MSKIAVATERGYAPPNAACADDEFLIAELAGRGHHVRLIDWRDQTVKLHDYDAIFVSSTWDIPSAPADFLHWCGRCESDGRRRVINDVSAIRDNVVKSRYLHLLISEFGETEKAAGSIIPSRFFAVNADEEDRTTGTSGETLHTILRRLDESADWKGKDIVLKPIVSADGRDTYLYGRSPHKRMADPAHVLTADSAAEAFDSISRSATTHGAIVQPYVESVEMGEYCLVFFTDVFSHAIHKPLGFRADVPDERRAVEEEQLPKNMLRFARRVVSWMTGRYGEGSLTRTRIDLLRGSVGPLLSEFECTEPSTSLQCFPQAARQKIVQRYADALEQRTLNLSARVS